MGPRTELLHANLSDVILASFAAVAASDVCIMTNEIAKGLSKEIQDGRRSEFCLLLHVENLVARNALLWGSQGFSTMKQTKTVCFHEHAEDGSGAGTAMA